ncbi:hypothetical protein Micbo1qcDRAFT_157356 [Microdochium bolleyi]|uniref:Uncharacterized protein n=1 Tax=Microdochium bolleyi TaxID=196109 RepID=A0A136JE63_9PEZI|nr:hypothetical protein Micbo1qcDRAFT_157356 [Microdochium bolleyi]
MGSKQHGILEAVAQRLTCRDSDNFPHTPHLASPRLASISTRNRLLPRTAIFTSPHSAQPDRARFRQVRLCAVLASSPTPPRAHRRGASCLFIATMASPRQQGPPGGTPSLSAPTAGAAGNVQSAQAELAKAFQDLARGEQHAAALEANLSSLESKLDALLASFGGDVDDDAGEAAGSQKKEGAEGIDEDGGGEKTRNGAQKDAEKSAAAGGDGAKGNDKVNN